MGQSSELYIETKMSEANLLLKIQQLEKGQDFLRRQYVSVMNERDALKQELENLRNAIVNQETTEEEPKVFYYLKGGEVVGTAPYEEGADCQRRIDLSLGLDFDIVCWKMPHSMPNGNGDMVVMYVGHKNPFDRVWLHLDDKMNIIIDEYTSKI